MKRFFSTLLPILILAAIFNLATDKVSAQEIPEPVNIADTIPQFDPQAVASSTANSSPIDPETGLPFGVEESLSTSITPKNPRPGEVSVIEVKSFALDINKTTISWYVNGVLEEKGTGLTTFRVQMGELGENKTVRMVVTKQNGGTIERTFNLVPAEIDIFYEANTYTPPFYAGKAWFTHQSTIRVMAVPRILDTNGRIIPADNFTYKWSVDGRVRGSQSGFGKNIFYITGPNVSSEMEIGVEVSPQNSSTVTSGKISVVPQRPVVSFYEKNPLYGTIFEQALSGSFFLNREEVSFEAVPFFFSNLDVFEGLDYEWNMNGNKITPAGAPNEITFRVEEDQQGIAEIILSAKNNAKILQSNTAGFNLFFEENSGSSREFSF